MCGRYYSRSQKQEIAKRLRAKKVFEDPYAPDFNIAPTTFQPIVRMERDADEREMVLARWGLLPFFAKRIDQFKPFSTFNARTETILEGLKMTPAKEGKKPPSMWTEPIKKRRCLVPADGFYEWPESEKGTKGPKHPYAITITNGEPLAFAGLWDAWKNPANGSWLQSFSIITTEANEIMAPIHSRMPVILHPNKWEEWLDRDDSRPPPVHLLRPYDAEAMHTEPCNPAVGNVKNNGPQMLVCPTPDGLPLNSA